MLLMARDSLVTFCMTCACPLGSARVHADADAEQTASSLELYSRFLIFFFLIVEERRFRISAHVRHTCSNIQKKRRLFSFGRGRGWGGRRSRRRKGGGRSSLNQFCTIRLECDLIQIDAISSGHQILVHIYFYNQILT